MKSITITLDFECNRLNNNKLKSNQITFDHFGKMPINVSSKLVSVMQVAVCFPLLF